jgi:hypothetical protein
MINKNSMVPSSITPIEDHYKLGEVRSTRKRIKNTKRGPRKRITPKGNEQH